MVRKNSRHNQMYYTKITFFSLPIGEKYDGGGNLHNFEDQIDIDTREEEKPYSLCRLCDRT